MPHIRASGAVVRKNLPRMTNEVRPNMSRNPPKESKRIELVCQSIAPEWTSCVSHMRCSSSSSSPIESDAMRTKYNVKSLGVVSTKNAS